MSLYTSISREDQILKKLLSLLSNGVALKIFLNAKGGLDASSLSPMKLKIPPKTYYSKLKKLIDIGLMEKIEGRYFYTTFGRIIYEQFLINITNHIRNMEHYAIIDTLKVSKKFTDDEIYRFLINITQGLDTIPNSQEQLFTKEYNNKGIDIFLSYEDMVCGVSKSIENCKREILIATRLFDEKLFNSIYHKAKQGIKVKVLCDRNLIRNYFQIYGKRLDSKDKDTMQRIKVVGNPWYQYEHLVERRITNIPFSIAIFDELEVGIEIIDKNEKENFECGILIKDKRAASTMMNFYNKIWQSALDG